MMLQTHLYACYQARWATRALTQRLASTIC